jgi:hypothetical protein
MQTENVNQEGEFDPSSDQTGKESGSWKGATRKMFGDTHRTAAKLAFAKANLGRPGKVYEEFITSAHNPKTRSETVETVRRAKEAAVDYYSDPENLGELGDRIKVALADYGHDVGAGLDEKERAQIKSTMKFSDSGEKAVHTKMMIDIYNESLGRLKKVAAVAKDRSFIKGEDGGELEEAPTPEKLAEDYKKATKRDRGYIWTLETDKDGKTRAVRKKAPTFGDWTRDTVDGMAAGSNLEEGIGYMFGRSLRGLVRLIPGLGEVEGKDQIRAKTARLYQQMESLIPTRKGSIHPHGVPGEKENRDAGDLSKEGTGEEGSGLKKGSGAFNPTMSNLGIRRDKNARGVGMT